MKNKIYVIKKEGMDIKEYKIRVINEKIPHLISVYATDVVIRDGVVLFYIDSDIQFGCTVTTCIFKLCPAKKNPIKKNAAIVSNSLIVI